jgi:hypothetical protein
MKKIIILSVFIIFFLCPGVLAHMPGSSAAPEVDLGPIVLMSNGIPVEISIEDVAAYHGEMEGKEPDACICCACMYRVMLCGINEIWGDETPERSDIGVQSRLVSNGALHTAWYITGTGPDMDSDSAGELVLLTPDGTELTDYSQEARMKIAKNRNIDDYRFVVTRLSTGESATLTLREELFPEDFFELRKKVKVEKVATDDETAEFLSKWSTLRDDLLQKPDFELFNEIVEPTEEEPDVVSGGIFIALICMCCLGCILMCKKNN